MLATSTTTSSSAGFLGFGIGALCLLRRRQHHRSSRPHSTSTSSSTTSSPSSLAPASPDQFLPPIPVNLTAADRAWLREHCKSLDWERVCVGVAARTPDGNPAVLKMYPLRMDSKLRGAGGQRKIPFPNLNWLAAPSLIKSVGRLEHQGMVKLFEKRLEAEEALMVEGLEADHERYAAERWALLTDEDRAYAQAHGYEKTLRETGLCGMVYKRRVKCLHAHYAHFLATGRSTVGAWTHAALAAAGDSQGVPSQPDM